MTKTERFMVIGIGAVIALSLFLMALKGRYRAISNPPCTYDSWSGKMYLGGTDNKKQKEDNSKLPDSILEKLELQKDKK
jgi:hypothetical protein